MHYRYRPELFSQGSSLSAETLYVVGGLYGNVEALRTVLAMRESEGGRVALLFNGDFNWFNVDEESFVEVNETVLSHWACQGNVEAELANPAEGGCGCNYPAYVSQETVNRSNAMMRRLQARALDFPEMTERLGRLPLYLTVEVGRQRIGIVHGDPESLSGWSFSAEALEPDSTTTVSQVADYFRKAQVSAFACTHTGLPVLQNFWVDGKERIVVNNGAAGLPNFKGTRHGVLTRISSRLEVPPNSLYGVQLESLRFDAMAIPFDPAAWMQRFLQNWPPQSPAYESYGARIQEGPDFSPHQAFRVDRTCAGSATLGSLVFQRSA